MEILGLDSDDFGTESADEAELLDVPHETNTRNSEELQDGSHKRQESHYGQVLPDAISLAHIAFGV